jgi:predicted nuclease with TOPRIM domain
MDTKKLVYVILVVTVVVALALSNVWFFTENESLQSQVNSLETENAALVGVNSNLESDNDRLQTDIAELESNKENLETQISNLQTTNSALEGQVSNLDSQIDDLTNQIEDLMAPKVINLGLGHLTIDHLKDSPRFMFVDGYVILGVKPHTSQKYM